MITGISHITFIVKDLNKTAQLFRALFDAEQVYSSGDNTFSLSPEMFFLIGGIWVCIMQGDPVTQRSYNHVAFQIPEQDFPLYRDRVKALSLETRPERKRVPGEGHSLYFYDYDHHLFELHTGTLRERLERYSR